MRQHSTLFRCRSVFDDSLRGFSIAAAAGLIPRSKCVAEQDDGGGGCGAWRRCVHRDR